MLYATKQIDLVRLSSFDENILGFMALRGREYRIGFYQYLVQEAVANLKPTYQPQQLTAGLELLSIPLLQRNWDAPHRQHRRDLAGAI